MELPDQLKSFRVFLEVISRGSFSAAGRSLGMSQTMVTKHIVALEQELGAELLRRTTRSTIATEVGEEFGKAARKILEDFEEAKSAIATTQGSPRGLLRLTAPASLGNGAINPLVAEFALTHPHVKIDLELTDRFVSIDSEGWDIAIRVGQPVDSALIMRKLASCRTIVCASPSYLQRYGAPRKISELVKHNCLGYTLSEVTNAQVWSFGRDASEKVEISGTFRSNSGDSLCTMACAGLGIIYQPAFLVSDLICTGKLVRLEFEQNTAELTIYALFPKANRQPAKVRSFLDFVVGKWKNGEYWDF